MADVAKLELTKNISSAHTVATVSFVKFSKSIAGEYMYLDR
jgi:hypothetical protein